MTTRFCFAWMLLAVAVGQGDMLCAQDDLAATALAVLESRCYRCHGGAAGKNANLDVLSRESVLQTRAEGDVQAAFVRPGEPENSLLWQAIDKQFMPLDGSPEARDM